MNKTVELLLTENVDNVGIVGDVVKVRQGYARNFLLPRGLATVPSDEAISALAERRAEAERQLRELRKQRETMIEKLEDFEITLTRACNDQGQLYGSVTQRDIAEALESEGFNIAPRDVRIAYTIKRVDSYRITIKLDQDLETEIKLWVVPDRQLPEDEREEMEFDNEGNLIVQESRKVEAAAEAPVAQGDAPVEEADAEQTSA